MTFKAEKSYNKSEFINSKAARPIRILSEYIEPETKFSKEGIDHTVVFFGSARIKPENDPNSEFYVAARRFSYELSLYSKEMREKNGNCFYICTGGGPGIMEAANRGANDAGEKTIGLNISLPFEQYANPYITEELNFEFHYFFTRKLWLLYHAKALVIFPGGFGTLDEMFETLTLIQTQKIQKRNIPVMLYCSEYWKSLINFQKLADMGMVSQEDLSLFHFFDSVEEGMEYIKPRLKDIIATVEHSLFAETNSKSLFM
ncbi:MAG: TIGR00730 family Rossman fold protein [Spirochaetota bacterium]